MNRTDDHQPVPVPAGTTAASPAAASGAAASAAPTRSRPHTLGAFGEAYAARHLTDRGMVLLDRNWRCELGEIDLVLRDGDVVVFCEVKTRSSALYGTPLEAVTARKAARLRRLAARWLAEHRLRPREVRLDLVGVIVPRTGAPSVEHAAGVG